MYRLIVTSLFLCLNWLGFSHSMPMDWKTVEIPCNYSSSANCGTYPLTPKIEIVFADCGNGVGLFCLESQTLNFSMVRDLHITGSAASIIECTSDQNTSTGIDIVGITNLRLENLQIRNCFNKEFDGSIRIKDSANIIVNNITIEHSNGTGLVLENNRKEVCIENSSFRYNGKNHDEESSHRVHSERADSGGGGVRVVISSDVRSSFVMITNCEFYKNKASKGGGLYIAMEARAQRNTVVIQNSTITGNSGYNGGGGGLQVGYINENRADLEAVVNNSIIVRNCTFKENSALYGGGMSIFSTLGSPEIAENKFEFSNCSWENNKAKLGMAVDVAIASWEAYTRAGLFPTPVFTDCSFSEHKEGINYKRSKSVFSITGFRVEFRGNLSFTENGASAIDATSAVLDFAINSVVEFIRNTAVYGGALKLIGLTTVFVHDNSTFLFEENEARHSGGAIYFESNDKHAILSSESCFLQHRGAGEEPRNVVFMFRNNTAGFENTNTGANNSRFRGDSLFTSTIFPCFEKCTKSLSSEAVPETEVLKCIGNFSFEGVGKRQLSTAAHHFSHKDVEIKNDSLCFLIFSNRQIYKNSNYSWLKKPPIKEISIIPGKTEKIPVKLIDELCGEVFFHVSVDVLKGSILVDPAHSIITDNHITLYGDPGDNGTIQLSTVGVQDIAIRIKVILEDCPPGYILAEGDKKECTCYSNIKKHSVGIKRCNETEFRAYMQHGYWVGYVPSHINNSSPLAKAICPRGFCDKSQLNSLREHLLPPKSKMENHSLYICSLNRSGTLCGTCTDNFVIHYHSMSFQCKTTEFCSHGWVFYVLSEIVPVTTLFLVIIFFNISFTSGPLNGVIFFMQMIETLKLNAENFVDFGEAVNVSEVYKLVYRAFSLNTFAIGPLTFCLWEGANALDMLAFRYVTITYSLFLVLVTTFFLKVCNFPGKLNKRKTRLFNLKRSIIHGLSTFLVMTYSECTRVSLMILTVGTLNTLTRNPITYKVAFYHGNYTYMEAEHLRYVIPAIFFLLTLVTVPPLLLLSYPLCYKLFALLRIEESKCVQITCKVFPLEKIKPMFDSMQGAFKDRYRCFAGLYLVYRLCLLLTFTYSSTLTAYYTITGIQLLGMLIIHSVCRPYKETWHNVLDALLLTNLAIINIMTFYNYQLLTSAMNIEETVKRIVGVQIALVFLPLVYLIIYTTYQVVKRIKVACVRKFVSSEQEEIDNADEVIDNLDRRDFDNLVMEMNDYILLGRAGATKQ